jgi:hypothetical protein
VSASGATGARPARGAGPNYGPLPSPGKTSHWPCRVQRPLVLKTLHAPHDLPDPSALRIRRAAFRPPSLSLPQCIRVACANCGHLTMQWVLVLLIYIWLHNQDRTRLCIIICPTVLNFAFRPSHGTVRTIHVQGDDTGALKKSCGCSLEDKHGDWVDVTVTPQQQPGAFSLNRPPMPGSLVILTSQRPPPRQALDWLTRWVRPRA